MPARLAAERAGVKADEVSRRQAQPSTVSGMRGLARALCVSPAPERPACVSPKSSPYPERREQGRPKRGVGADCVKADLSVR